MQNKSNKLTKILMGTLLTSSAVIMAGGVNALKPNLRVYANSTPTSVSIDNSSFSSSSTTASNWTALTSGSSVVTATVVDTKNFDEKKDNYNISVNPSKVASATDNNVFMINSADMAVSYGYESNQFSLNANGYYIVNVPVKTQNGGVASVYLTDGNDFTLKCENIVSTSNYNTYSFYVKTNKTLNVKLQLFLGSKSNVSSGAVFFDEITAYSYAESTFYSLYNERTQRNDNNIESASGFSYEWQISDNANFTKISESGSNASADGFVQRIYSLDSSTILPENVENPTNGNLINNNYALLLVNPNEASVGVRYKNNLTLPMYDYILLSTYVKTNTTSGGVTIKLSTYDEEKDEYTALDSVINNFTTSSSDTKLEGWEKVSFAVKTSAFENKDVYLEFWLGNGDNKAKGYAFVGKLEYSQITSEEYNNYSTSSSLVKVELDNKTEDSTSFKNHSFNNFIKTEIEENNKMFVEANNLTKVDSHKVNYGTYNVSDNFASGIVNTNQNVFNNKNYPFANPGLTPIQTHSNIEEQTNNVFAIYQKSLSYQEYKTDNITLNANTNYKLTIYVKTAVANGGAKWALYNDDMLISEFTDIVSNSEWTTLTTYVKTGIKNLESFNARIGLGTQENGCIGTAFFDDMMVETCEDDVFNSAVKSSTTNIVDLKTDSFNLNSGKQANGLYNSSNWSTNQTSQNFIGGVMDTNNVSQDYLNNLNMTNPLSPNGNSNVLVINNREDLISTYTNSISYTLSANSYYKISVWVKTYGLSQGEENLNYSDSKNTKEIPYGAIIYLDNVAEKFEGITDSDWTQYTFYINSSDEIEMVMHLGLGYENAKTSGYAYFSDVTVESLEEDEYTVQTATYADQNNLPKTVKLVASAEKKEDESEENSNSNSSMGEFNYLIIPTLITAIAILIAIIGTILRQIKFNKFVKLKKKTNSYDRNKVKVKSVRNAEIQNIVNEKLKELTQKQTELEAEQATLENEVIKYKEEFISFKGKKLTKEEKQARKLAKQNYYNAYNNLIIHLQDITTLKDDINKIKSEKYILKEEYNLMKKTLQEEKEAKKLEKRNEKAKKN